MNPAVLVYVRNAEKLPALVAEYSKYSFLLGTEMIVILFDKFARVGVPFVNHLKTFRTTLFGRCSVLPIKRHKLLPRQLFDMLQTSDEPFGLLSRKIVERVFFIQ
jgi:hypothetical protein